MANPLISICIPTYNGEMYLKECIDSCLNQTFSNYEIIICDDGSIDNTVNIIKDYNDSKIKIFNNSENLGLVGNWNKCIEVANGEWIKFVFQDDYITNNCLQQFVNNIDDKTHLIVCKRDFILPKNATSDYVNYYTNEVRTLENTTSFRGTNYSPQLITKIAIENICMNFIGEPSLIFFRKSCVEKYGFFNSELKQICDLEFALKIASHVGLTYIPEKLCSFRIHNNSTTNSNVNTKFFEMHYIEPILYSYFLLFDTIFKRFREQLTSLQLLKLKLYFKLKTYKAFKISLGNTNKFYLFDDSNSQYPEIQMNKRGNLFIKLLSVIV